jgi:hypothetical protein
MIMPGQQQVCRPHTSFAAAPITSAAPALSNAAAAAAAGLAAVAAVDASHHDWSLDGVDLDDLDMPVVNLEDVVAVL